MDSSIIQPPNPKSFDKPKHHTVSQQTTSKPISNSKPKHPTIGQHSSTQPISNSKPKPIPNPKPKPISNPKPKQTFGWSNSKPKDHTVSNPKPPNTKPNILPASNPKPNRKPIFKWKPKAHRPSLSHYLTHPHSSQAPPSLPFSSAPSVMGNVRSDSLPLLTHLAPTCSEKLLSVRDNSEASNTESLSSDATLEVSLCSDDDVDLQRNIQQIIHQHTDDVIKKWGNSEQWVLKL